MGEERIRVGVMSKRGKRNTKRLSEQIDDLTQGAPEKRTVTYINGSKIERETQIVSIRKTPIAWGIPCDELSFSRFWTYFIKNANYMPWDAWIPSEGTYLVKARNEIHNGFLSTNLEWLMMLDSDVLFPPNIAEILKAHNLPIVAGWYRDKKSRDKHPCVYDFSHDEENGLSVWNHRDTPGKGVERVGATGAGCILMSREVAEKLGRDPYGHNIGGEDMIMCRKLITLDIPLHVDWSVNCAHAGVFHV